MFDVYWLVLTNMLWRLTCFDMCSLMCRLLVGVLFTSTLITLTRLLACE